MLALLTVVSSPPNCSLGNRSALCLPPVLASKASLNLVAMAHCALPSASPMATLKLVANALAPVIASDAASNVCVMVFLMIMIDSWLLKKIVAIW